MTSRNRTAITLFLVLTAAIAIGAFATAEWRVETPAAPASGSAAAARETASELPVTGDLSASAFRQIASTLMPTVVSIQTLRTERAATPELFGDEALRRFFGLPEGRATPRERILEGAGSGFIIDASGLVLTNNHVVENASRIQVVLFPDPNARPSESRRLEATVVGRDPFTDSALLQLKDASKLPVAPLGNSDAMRPGDWVMAIGNPFALSHTVTVGVVSATARPFPLEGRPQRVLQTDAAINPGNSGGPLINLLGEVVGVNTAIFSPMGPRGGNIGIGFAVPINLVNELIPQLRKGDVRRGRLGVEIRDVPADAVEALGVQDTRGALVASVESGGPADRAGVQPGDVIVQARGEPLENADELVSLIAGAQPGTNVPLAIVRDGQEVQLNVTLGELGSNRTSPPTGQGGIEQLGMTLQELPPSAARQLGLQPGQAGAILGSVTPGSAAAEAGLQPGDVVLEVNRQPVSNLSETAERLTGIAPGEAGSLLVLRDGRKVFVVLTRPD